MDTASKFKWANIDMKVEIISSEFHVEDLKGCLGFTLHVSDTE